MTFATNYPIKEYKRRAAAINTLIVFYNEQKSRRFRY